jgi:hypothetical protein
LLSEFNVCRYVMRGGKKIGVFGIVHPVGLYTL